MKKNTLQKLVSNNLGFHNRQLDSFLQTKQSLKDDENISFKEFTDFLKKNEFKEILPDLKAVESVSDEVLFTTFIQKPHQNSTLSTLPKSLRGFVTNYLDGNDLTAFAATHSGFFAETRHVIAQKYNYNQWRQKLIEIGCQPKIIDDISRLNVISNYKTLYETLTRYVDTHIVKHLSLSRLLAASGDPKAISYCKKILRVRSGDIATEVILSGKLNALNMLKLKITDDDYFSMYQTAVLSGSPAMLDAICKIKGGYNNFQVNFKKRLLFMAISSHSPLMLRELLKNADFAKVCRRNGNLLMHHATEVGSLPALKIILQISKANPLSLNKDRETLLQNAAISGSIELFDFVSKIEGMDPLHISTAKHNLAHFAAEGGSVDILNRVLKMDGIDPLAKDVNGNTLLHFAVRSGSIDMLNAVLKIEDIDPLAINKYKKSLAHIAASSDNFAMLKRVLSIPGINPLDKSDMDRTLLHHAVYTSAVDAVVYLRLLGEQLQKMHGLKTLPFDPLEVDAKNHNAIYCARLGVLEIREILAKPLDTLKVEYPYILDQVKEQYSETQTKGLKRKAGF